MALFNGRNKIKAGYSNRDARRTLKITSLKKNKCSNHTTTTTKSRCCSPEQRLCVPRACANYEKQCENSACLCGIEWTRKRGTGEEREEGGYMRTENHSVGSGSGPSIIFSASKPGTWASRMRNKEPAKFARRKETEKRTERVDDRG